MKEFDIAHVDPERWLMLKDDIYLASSCLRSGLEYAQEALIVHDEKLGRTTLKNKRLAEMMEEDIYKFKRAIEKLSSPCS